MGKRGPQPKSPENKALEGNPGNRNLQDYSPREDVSGSDLVTPRLTNADERQGYREVVEAMPKWWFTQADKHALIAYAQAYGRMRHARRVLTSESMVISRSNGSRCVNPILTVLQQAENDVMKWRDELGLSRAKRAVAMPQDPERIPTRQDEPQGGGEVSEFGGLLSKPRLAHSAS